MYLAVSVRDILSLCGWIGLVVAMILGELPYTLDGDIIELEQLSDV